MLLLIFNCHDDNDFQTSENISKQERNLKIRPIFPDDKANNPKAFQKLESPKGKLNIQSYGKVIYDSINNFSINTDIGVYIEEGDYHSFTFRLDRPNGSDYLLENIVVSKNMNTLEYDVILFQYDITEHEYELINDNQYVNYEDRVTMTLLEDTNIATEVFGKVYFADSCYDQELVNIPGNSCPNGHTWSYVLDNAGTDDQCTYLGHLGTPTPDSWTWQSVEVACPSGGGGQDPTNPAPPDGGGSSGVNLIFTNTVGLQDWEKVERCINFLDETGTDTVYIPQNLIADLQEPQNAGLAKQCSDYLEANQCDVNAQAFVVLAIEASNRDGIDDGEVDWDDNVILSEEFKNNEKLKCVYDKLAGGNSTLFRDTIGSFIDNPNVNIVLTIGDCTQGSSCADTRYVAETGIITINIQDIDSNPINIAGWILHEAIHAELARYVLENDSTVDTDDHPRLFELYRYYKSNNTPPHHLDHPYMTMYYITPIATALRQYDNNSYPLDYYKGFAWTGLTRWDVNNIINPDLINNYNQYESIVIQNSTVCD